MPTPFPYYTGHQQDAYAPYPAYDAASSYAGSDASDASYASSSPLRKLKELAQGVVDGVRSVAKAIKEAFQKLKGPKVEFVELPQGMSREAFSQQLRQEALTARAVRAAQRQAAHPMATPAYHPMNHGAPAQPLHWSVFSTPPGLAGTPADFRHCQMTPQTFRPEWRPQGLGR